MENKEFLILVDEKDQQWGKLEKELVHQLGLLHRAFSIFIFNSKGELLLQQRADSKYHSGGLWTNTCCSHPRFGEDLSDAVNRRLIEEMGMKSKTEFAFSFVYKANFENGLTEHEFDHVFFGVTDDLPKPEKLEVKDWKYMNIKLLENDLEQNPHQYTAWLKICFNKVLRHLENKNLKIKKVKTLEYAQIHY
ncbi:MAG: isopentenyl-diphosphate Delta-isomerase [Bacteroidia bacterium]